MTRFGPKPKPLADRFWSKVDKTADCWLWTAGTNGRYGQFFVSKKLRHFYAHRMAFMLANGITDLPGHDLVCHHCDNPLCVRPDHLFLGDQSDNILDAVKKGRHVARKPSPALITERARLAALPRWGRRAVRSPLTPDDVIEIRRALANGERPRDIAPRYGVNDSCIIRIRSRQRWNLPGL